MLRCPTCLALLGDDKAKRCPSCRTNLRRKPPIEMLDKRRTTAALLAVDVERAQALAIQQAAARDEFFAALSRENRYVVDRVPVTVDLVAAEAEEAAAKARAEQESAAVTGSTETAKTS